jgi:hypothetical protein
MAVRFTYHGSPFASQISQQGFRPGGLMSIAPGQVFSSPSASFASGYGSPVRMVTPTNALSIPSANLSTGTIGSEVIQSPKAATKGMNLASKVGTTYTGPTAQRLASGATVAGLGAPPSGSLAMRLAGGPFGIGSLVGTGIGMGADAIARATNTPEEYEAMKEKARSDYMGTGYFDDIDISQDAPVQGLNLNDYEQSITANEPMDIEDFLGTSTPQDLGFIGNAPSIQEAVAPVGITDRGRGMPGAPTGAYEMIGGTPVAVGDVLGRQQALEKADFVEETPQGINFDVLGTLGTLGGLLTGSTALRGLGMFGNYKSGRMGRAADAISSGLGSLAGRMRGINPVTGRPNTQAQYEQARADRQQQSRVDNVAARLAANKKTLSDPYSIAKTKEQREQIREAKVEGAKKDTSMGETGYGSCFIAGTKVSMADGTFKNIEYVKVGDKVKGHKEDNEVIKLDPTSLGDRKLYSFNNNQHYFFTSEHPFMTEEGWKSIKPEKTKERDGVELYEQLKGELKVGDKLVTDNGLVKITNIDSKEMNSPEMSLYNFNVSNDNSYIADGYIVHNKGGGGKIVCTMMNERYGFGSFRNKIWMKFHEGYSKDYIKGYHAIFLPLVKIAKGKGKINTAVRKVLEHMGRHVTADMFKIMKGKKRDTLGRIYRAIFEPTCHIIGKIKSALGRG